MTRTHTVMFRKDAEPLLGLAAAINEVHKDWESRRPHMNYDLYIRGVTRINLLWSGVELLTERAD